MSVGYSKLGVLMGSCPPDPQDALRPFYTSCWGIPGKCALYIPCSLFLPLQLSPLLQMSASLPRMLRLIPKTVQDPGGARPTTGAQRHIPKTCMRHNAN